MAKAGTARFSSMQNARRLDKICVFDFFMLSLYFLSLWIYLHQSVLFGYGGIITCTQSTFLANSIICILGIYNFLEQIPQEASNSILSAGLGCVLGLLFVYMDNSGFGIADVCPCQHPVGITQG